MQSTSATVRILMVLLFLIGNLVANEETLKDLAEHPPTTESPVGTVVTKEEPQVEEPPSALAKFNNALVGVIFLDVTGGAIQVPVEEDGQPVLDESGAPKTEAVEIPLIVVILSLGSIFFTFWYRFISIRLFKHGIDVVRGKYDNPDNKGEISHFRALTSALSATVGLGNIAGVAVAIQQGGPGAVFWMICMAVFGMTAKFSSCTLSQLYRKTNPNGTISGGPMYYLDLGLRDLNLGGMGKFLGILYAIMLMGGAFGGGNMFQVNQTAEAFRVTFDLPARADLAVGIMMLVVVGMVIVGGVRRIGSATSKIIPFMCGTYVLASVMIIIMNFDQVPSSIALIFNLAFSENAMFGGAMGVLVTGVTRAAFSNEAGLGSAAVVHAAAKTDEPVREGVVAMLGPFIDTIVICTMTALVVIVTGAYEAGDAAEKTGYANGGVALTMIAFESAASWLPYVLTISIALFAYSTMISWCYYGERGWIYLIDHFGEGKGIQTVIVFRLLFLAFILVGALNSLSDVLLFSDLMILSLAFPNIIGSIILAPKVLKMLKDYTTRLSSGEMKQYK
jgi:alanine or glycine:cation symporter, AGCS family